MKPKEGYLPYTCYLSSWYPTAAAPVKFRQSRQHVTDLEPVCQSLHTHVIQGKLRIKTRHIRAQPEATRTGGLSATGSFYASLYLRL